MYLGGYFRIFRSNRGSDLRDIHELETVAAATRLGLDDESTVKDRSRVKAGIDSPALDPQSPMDDVIGSEKFFQFALPRKGKRTPSKNIRRIISAYTEIAENKIALDRVLPEGEFAVQNLLQKMLKLPIAKFQNLSMLHWLLLYLLRQVYSYYQNKLNGIYKHH